MTPLLAQLQPHARRLADDPFQLILPIALLALGLLGLITALWFARRLLTPNEDAASSEHELLAELRDLNDDGELSDDEYRNIKKALTKRIRNKWGNASAEDAKPDHLLKNDVNGDSKEQDP